MATRLASGNRGHGHDVSTATKRLIRTTRSLSEGVIEAWANLYTEFAKAVAARQDGVEVMEGWLGMPGVEAGAAGVRFIDAAVRSDEGGGVWVEI